MKFAASRSARRRTGAAALAAAALLGATGCSAVSPIATAFHYSASDGLTADPMEDLGLRNVALVGDEAAGESTPGRFIGSLQNLGEQDGKATLTVNGTSVTVDVPKGQMVSLEKQELTVEDAGARTGARADMKVSFAPAGGQQADADVTVPVLSGVLPEYASFAPGGADTEELQKHLHEESGAEKHH